MPITLYGLKNCDTCKKALKGLAGHDAVFVDIRTDADLATLVPKWLESVGKDLLLNTRSTTWRSLSDEDKARAETDPASLLISAPTLIKRPVIENNSEVLVGWSSKTAAQFAGNSSE